MNIFDYLFNIAPGQKFSYYPLLSVFIGLLFVAAIVFSRIYNNKRKNDFAFKRLFRKTSGRLALFGLLFLIAILLRYENIPYFAMRIWIYLIGLFFIYFVYKTIKVYKKDYPRERENAQRKVHVPKQENKYLPHKKKR